MGFNMNLHNVFGAAAAVSFLTTTGAQAVVFDFFWTGDSSVDATILLSQDDTLRAVGTIEIDALAGQSFGLGDIVTTDITVSGSSITDFTFTTWSSAGGTISADGLSASFDSAGNPFYQSDDFSEFFGCQDLACQNAIHAINGSLSPLFTVRYSSPSDVLASYTMTAQLSAVPVPASAPLLIAGIAGMAALGRRRKQRRVDATGSSFRPSGTRQPTTSEETGLRDG